jgi:hypothetical protein
MTEIDQPTCGFNEGRYWIRPDSGDFHFMPSTIESKGWDLLLHEPLQHLAGAGNYHPDIRLGLFYHAGESPHIHLDFR